MCIRDRYNKVLAPQQDHVAHVLGVAEPHPDLFFMLIPNLKTESIYLTKLEFYCEFQFFVFFNLILIGVE